MWKSWTKGGMLSSRVIHRFWNLFLLGSIVDVLLLIYNRHGRSFAKKVKLDGGEVISKEFHSGSLENKTSVLPKGCSCYIPFPYNSIITPPAVWIYTARLPTVVRFWAHQSKRCSVAAGRPDADLHSRNRLLVLYPCPFPRCSNSLVSRYTNKGVCIFISEEVTENR